MACARMFTALGRVGNVLATKPMTSFSRPSLISKSQYCTGSELIFDVQSVDDFNEKVINSPTPVLVDFHADWCGPCRVLGPRLEEKVLGRNGEVLMAKVNVDYAGELAMDYQISAVPTIIFFKNGEPLSQFAGVLEDNEIDEFIDHAISN